MAKVKALRQIKHDGVELAPGETVECSDAQAKHLIQNGAAEKVGTGK